MSHLASIMFFALVLTGSVFAISLTLREYWAEIIGALKGDVPVRRHLRPWASPRMRASARPRPAVAARVVVQQRAAV